MSFFKKREDYLREKKNERSRENNQKIKAMREKAKTGRKECDVNINLAGGPVRMTLLEQLKRDRKKSLY